MVIEKSKVRQKEVELLFENCFQVQFISTESNMDGVDSFDC